MALPGLTSISLTKDRTGHLAAAALGAVGGDAIADDYAKTADALESMYGF